MESNRILFDLLKNNKYDEFKKEMNKDDHIDINVRDDTGNYLITYAIIKNNIELVKLLLSRDCRIDITDQEGRSLLYLPIKYDYSDIVNLLIEYNKQSIGISIVDVKDKFNNIPLHYAIFFKNIKAIDMLLQSNSNTNTLDEDGNNSLHLAIYTKNYDICKKIINSDVNINAKTIIGESALHIACNFQFENIVKLLVDVGIDVNIQDYNNEITALSYAVNLNNRNITKYLLLNKANPNIQDFMGNNAIHYAIIEESNEILYELTNSDKYSIKPNFNIHNISGKLPLHILLYKDKVNENETTKKIIYYTDLNFQDNEGNTPMHLLCKKNIWKTYSDIIIKKKLDVFIKNNKNIRPIDLIDKKELNEFIDLVSHSYLYILRNYNFVWKNDWENICNKEIFYDKLTPDESKILAKYITNPKDDVCYNIVKLKINEIHKNNKESCGNASYPTKISKRCIQITNVNSDFKVEMCSFVGITLDILVGLIYLLNKHPNACSTLTSNFMKNTDLCNYYLNIGIKTNAKCEFLNFEIVWIYKKLFFSENFTNNFKKCINNNKIRFIIIPLGIELKEGSHANYLIFDKKTHQLERFEPYGSDSPHKFNYNSKLLDNVLSFKFSEINSNIEYINPEKYLPKVSFQYFDAYEPKTQKIGDPGGFCALWSIWYTDMRLTYPDIEREKLVKKLLKEIKMKNISFKNLIRNYSINITQIRDNVLGKAKVTINDWLNDQLSENQYDLVIKEITLLLTEYLK